MALLKLVEKEEATPKVAEIYQNMNDRMGFIPGSFKMFGLSEHVLGQQVNNIRYFSVNTRFSGKLLAFIRLMVSEEERCEYCVDVNTGILFQYGILPEQVTEILNDHTKVPLEENEKALLFFVLKVVKNSKEVSKVDVDNLLNLGWTDADILEASYHGASQVGMDKLFNAFQVHVEG